ncbi:MAG: hypothetical protein A2Y75_05155 [Candidatus Solincola sediminis]|uniref:SF3 helicase domain-containing protein n=1 Tax=Candidatus Solincola sediminis TaxID=1797199 RepID=A0A1F2WG18_9ACTN|nr:MAG: hypothetical protein A2Y75_05155 [Candidatus Solincola sediminis]
MTGPFEIPVSEPTPEELLNVQLLTRAVEAHTLPRNDDGGGQRVVVYFGDRLRYVKEQKEWRFWDGKRWCLATQADLMWVARRVARSIFREGELFEDDQDRAQHAAYARGTSSLSRMDAMIKVACGDERLWAAAKSFDADPFILNFLNGTYDLRTDTLRPHNPDDLNTHLIPHNYVRDAPAPLWEGLIHRVVAGADGTVTDVGQPIARGVGHEVYDFVQLALGYSALGTNSEHVIFFFQGDTRCGKSKLLEIAHHALGGDYAHQSNQDLIAKKRLGHHSSETFSLIGRHFIAISETPTTFALDENRVKSLTGDSMQTVYQLYSGTERVVPTTWTICLATNNPPNVEDWDGAIRERIVVIPCGPTVPSEERVQNLDALIKETETEGVLAWLVRGAHAWYTYATSTQDAGGHELRGGLRLPDSVHRAMDTFAFDNDHIGAFIEDVLIVTGDAGSRVSRSAVLDRAKRWKSRGEATVISRNKLYARISALRGVTTNTAREFVGLELRPEGGVTPEQHAWAMRMRDGGASSQG